MTTTTATPRQLYSSLGLARDAGLVAAYIPETAEMMMEHPIREIDDDLIMYTVGDLALDIISERERPVRWWQVKNYARAHRFNFPEPIWTGAAEDFRLKSLPNVPQPEGTKLAIRQYARGPWITISTEDFLTYD